jgi:hypothetical protein
MKPIKNPSKKSTAQQHHQGGLIEKRRELTAGIIKSRVKRVKRGKIKGKIIKITLSGILLLCLFSINSRMFYV